MKASVYIATTLDGFIARENGGLDWLPGSDGNMPVEAENEDYGFNSFLQSIDVLVMGRNTYEFAVNQGAWPYENKQVIVLSSTLRRLADGVPNTVELRSESPNVLYENLMKAGARHLYVDGGKTIQGFLSYDLIDEIIITRIPVMIGVGIPLFGPLKKDKKLKHVETKAYKNGFVQSKYRIISQDINRKI